MPEIRPVLNQMSLAQLRDRLDEACNLEEIEQFCFILESRLRDAGRNMRVNLEAVSGRAGGKRFQIQQLLMFLDRRGLLAEFIAVVREDRPDID